MAKYVINIVNNEKNVATSKAKDDIAFFLKKLNYETINLQRFQNRLDKLLSTKRIIKAKFKILNSGDLLLLQYPTYLGYRFEKKLIKYLKKKKVKIVILIHDVDSLRFKNKRQPSLIKEIEELNKADYVISSNEVMDEFLKNNGLTTLSGALGIFDYYHKEKVNKNMEFVETLNYAGNLNKSKFIFDFPKFKKLKLKLFGNIENKSALPKYEIYKGIFPSDKLTSQFTGGFGLVWDGESSTRVKGTYGMYLKYNNPHKLSLYLSAGLPVILWKEAALSSFVQDNEVGILVENLTDVESTVKRVSCKEYENMCRNARKIGNKLISGYYTTKAIEIAEEKVLHVN